MNKPIMIDEFGVDINDAPEGYKAVGYEAGSILSCFHCAFFHIGNNADKNLSVDERMELCGHSSCEYDERADGQNCYFVKSEERHE